MRKSIHPALLGGSRRPDPGPQIHSGPGPGPQPDNIGRSGATAFAELMPVAICGRCYGGPAPAAFASLNDPPALSRTKRIPATFTGVPVRFRSVGQSLGTGLPQFKASIAGEDVDGMKERTVGTEPKLVDKSECQVAESGGSWSTAARLTTIPPSMRPCDMRHSQARPLTHSKSCFA